jgi:hypothetical protein
MSSAKTYRNGKKMPKRSLFDSEGKIQIEKFELNSVKLDAARVKHVEEAIASLEDAEVITQEILQLEFSV